MRPSSARLINSDIRLAELRFPAGRVHVSRTRLAFIHLDNLLHFAKADRDGQVDGYVIGYLPDEVVLLLLRKGQVVNAVAIAASGRTVLPIANALRHFQQEGERAELAYCDAPLEQIAWMYQSCAGTAESREIDLEHPESLFPTLHDERFTGVVELISDGLVNYVRLEKGEFVQGLFSDKPDAVPVGQHMQTLFAPHEDGTRREIIASVFPYAHDLPDQASPELIHTYRELFWSIAERAEQETSGSAAKHVRDIRDLLKKVHTPLDVIGLPLEEEAEALVTTGAELTYALSDWALQLLEQVEITAPGAAPTILRDATRDHRYVLQRAGFYERLPWTFAW